LVEGSDLIKRSLSNRGDKDSLVRNTKSLKKTFGRSLALVSDLPIGYTISAKDLTLKKPGTGIQYHEMDQIIGRSLRVNKSCNRLLTWDDLE